ncbi:hypothetical protein MA16_Dca012452 [Dendrobium catenatum]|uniref:Uncharacterized protein n=1 Tax=Dendrobium catenatum TaxID=906689 RepID=A0A2I0XD18_9ASPA|nr:hypothetical protein MA16_Dca012452 [Dendrobium catenatum]
MVLSIDLNEVSPESRQFEESAAPTDLLDEHPASHNGSGTVPSAIDADAIDDEVTLLTASEWYAEVWSQIRRKRSLSIAIDETLETNAEHSGYFLNIASGTSNSSYLLLLGKLAFFLSCVVIFIEMT